MTGVSTVDNSRFLNGINILTVGVRDLETRWLTACPHPRDRPARDQDVEGHHQPQIGPAPAIVRMDPCRHVDAPVLPDHADAEVEMAVVGAEDDLAVRLVAGWKDRPLWRARLQAEGADKGVPERKKGARPTGQAEAESRCLTRGEGGGDRIAIEEISGPVQGPERGGGGQGVGSDGGHGERMPRTKGRGKGVRGRRGGTGERHLARSEESGFLAA